MKPITEINRKVNPLGVCKGKYCFYSKNTKYLAKITAVDLVKEPILFSLVGDSLLAKHFPVEKIDKETGMREFIAIDYKGAGKYLMAQCHELGIFKPELMRGLGVWEDEKRTVVNTGINLVVDNIEIEYDDFQKESDFTYDQPGKQLIKLTEQATQEDLDVVWNTINGFLWNKPHQPYLLLGALVQAIVGSALDWRAHVWINGSQGSGKSFLQFKFIRKLLGEMCLGVVNGTTMSGITSKLDYNTYAVSYDEAEVRTSKDHATLSGILGLARASSSQESTFIKGSASGDAVEYRCQSTFIMSSIAPFLKQESDIARFAILELVAPPKEHREEQRIKFHEQVTQNCLKIDKAFSRRWITFCIGLLPQIHEFRRSIDLKLAAADFNARTRDQYGQLIACASAVLGKEINLEIFEETLEETKDNDAQAEPLRVFNKVMGSEIRIPTKFGGEQCTIQESINTLYKLLDDRFIPKEDHELSKYDKDKLFRFLCTYGLKVQEGELFIANTNEKLENLIGKPNWNSLFCLIPEFERGDHTTSFGTRSYKSRYVSINLDYIVKTDYLSPVGF